MRSLNPAILALIALTVITANSSAQDSSDDAYSPYIDRDFPMNVYFGDTHLHTSISLDAFGDGNKRIGPDEAYRFANGEVLEGHDGKPVRMSRPLDFLMVADHGEYMGIMQAITEGEPGQGLLATETGKRWAELMARSEGGVVFADAVADITTNSPRIRDAEFEGSTWKERIIEAAEHHNQPGIFTALIGYEYTSFPEGDNLHRVVMFRDGADKAGQVIPFSAFDSQNPEDLWDFMEGYEKKTGGQIIAIPHNSNLSAGTMFALQTFEGNPLTREYAEKRMRWEPIYEVTQMKGDSETHPVVSPDDEFADFESWDQANLMFTKRSTDETKPYEYARPALKHGLVVQAETGANPFKFGLIGATDSHTGYSNAEEDNYLGKYAIATPSKDRWDKIMLVDVPDRVASMYEYLSSMSGLAAVWARENTREAIFDAMVRKEVYATTGPRMRVRVFGGFDLDPEDATSPKLADIGYSQGVPMGGDLTAAPAGKAPTFLVSALRDPDGANLDRIQMVKGWLDSDGKLHEKIYDIAAADGRAIVNGKIEKPVGSTVDLETATFTNTIGDATLIAGWTDPDFDPGLMAFYYVRLIEIPTPRWTAYDVVRLGAEMPKEAQMVLQERAYTSPIWYTP